MPPAKIGPIAGVDLGGTNMQIGVVSLEAKGDGKMLGEAKKKTRAEEGQDAIISRIAEGIVESCAAAKLSLKDLAGVGIGAPGAVDPFQGVVLEAVNLRWANTPLANLLSKRLGGVPVFLDNDVNVALYGEWRMGAAKGENNCLGVWVGTGIGGALILDGKMWYGPLFTAGEIGHTILFPTNPPGHRSLEHNCSRTTVVDRLIRLIESNRKSILPKLAEGDLSKVKSRTVAKAYEAGDELTLEVVNDAADMLGIAISNVVTLLSLPYVVLGGGLTEAIGQPFVDRVEKSCRKFAFPERVKAVKVVESKLMDQAGVYGAAMIARDRLDR
ncbi:MAG: ROK family protein [Planctomycetota bacterium]|nr:ROK family protein [Planctomycetota bacterium]